jgi:hypothetical protein
VKEGKGQKVERLYRGVRVRRSKLGLAVRRRVASLYPHRAKEAEAAVEARFERSVDRIIRKYYGRHLLAKQRVVKEKRVWAASFLQHYLRDSKGRAIRKTARELMAQLALKKKNAATRMQSVYRGHRGYRRARKQRYRKQRVHVKRVRAARMLQRASRGRTGRKAVNALRKELEVRMFAARRLQAVWRGTKTESLASMLQNAMKERVRNKARAQGLLSIRHADAAEQKRLDDLEKDSCSEDSDMLDELGDVLPELDDGYVEEGDDWAGPREDENGLTFWFSPSRNEKRFQAEKPPRPHAFERALVNCRVKVYWPLEEDWFEGVLAKFNPRHSDGGNGRHKVVYEDGDHEWLELKLETDRVQLFDAKNQVWLSFQIVINEEHSRSRKEKKAIALAKQYAEVGEYFEALYVKPAGDYKDAPAEGGSGAYSTEYASSSGADAYGDGGAAGAIASGAGFVEEANEGYGYGYGEDAFAGAMEPVARVQGDWEMLDAGGGSFYWFNHVTEESTWERPAGFV